jgi:hypothetical protein
MITCSTNIAKVFHGHFCDDEIGYGIDVSQNNCVNTPYLHNSELAA